MTISTTTIKNSYSGNGSTSAFTYTFKITSENDVQVIVRSSTGAETLKTKTTHYTVLGVGNANGGTITFTAGNIPITTQTVILRRSTPQTQELDLIENSDLPSDSIENSYDKLTSITQELQEQIDRSIKLSRTNTIASTEFTVGSTDRANKILAFDGNGEISVTQALGIYKGNWAAGIIYERRDLVRDTTTGNIFILNASHTSSGVLPLTTNINSTYYSLIVDAATAAASATASAASAAAALASQNSATSSASAASSSQSAAAGSASAASSSATASAASAASAATSFDDFDDRYLGSKSSAPTLDNDGNALITGTLYFNSVTSQMFVRDSGAWINYKPSPTEQGYITTVAGISGNVTTVAGANTNIGLIAGQISPTNNISTVAGAVGNIGTVATANTNVGLVAGQISPTNNIATVAGANANITTVAAANTNIGIVGGAIANVNTVATNIANINSVNSNSSNINAVNSNSTNINTVAGANANITTLAGISGAISSVASNASNISTVATDIAKIITAANDLNEATSEIEVVANAIANVDTVGGAIANVNLVGGSIANVNSVASNSTNINAVNSNATNINTVATANTNITSVAGSIANINTVAGANANISTVAAANTNISTVAGANTNIGTVATNVANVNLVGGSIANVNLAGGNIAAITTVNSNSTNINSVAGGVIPTRVLTIADATSISLNSDAADFFTQANTQVIGTLTINAPTGSPVNAQRLIIRIRSTNVQTFAWNAIFIGSDELFLPTVTSGSTKYDYFGFFYNTTASKWQLVSKLMGF